MFRYWLQGGRITTGFLGAAQIDKFGNINTSVIGPYEKPKVRLPGGGGAPEIASSCGKVYVTMKQSRRGFVDKVDFVNSFGFGDGGNHRARLGLATEGPVLLVTDLCIMKPHPETREFIVVSLHLDIALDDVAAATGWALKTAQRIDVTPPPNATELDALRALNARTAKAHGEVGGEA